MFSTRTVSNLAQSAFQTRWAVAQRRPDFLDLTSSNPTSCGVPYDTPALKRALNDADWSHYQADCRGLLSARECVAQHFVPSGTLRRGPAPEPSQLLLSASTSEAYSNLFKILCDPGDSVLVPEPSYPLFAELARYDCVELLPYPLLYDGAWYIDVQAVKRLRKDNTRALIVVSPNNPTGTCLKRDELSALLELDLPLISDEVFAGYAIAGRDACSVWEAQGVGLNFVLDGLSKWAGLPQCKLAWTLVCGETNRVAQALEQLDFVADTYLSANGMVQAALPGLLRAAQLTHTELLKRVNGNRATLDRLIAGSVCTRLHSEGGWSAVLQLPNTRDEESWVSLLLEQGIGVQPGWYYDFSFGPTLVLSLITPEPLFELGVSLLLRIVSG